MRFSASTNFGSYHTIPNTSHGLIEIFEIFSKIIRGTISGIKFTGVLQLSSERFFDMDIPFF
jgi:hypothetical protein